LTRHCSHLGGAGASSAESAGSADHGIPTHRIPGFLGPGGVISVEETARTYCIKCGRFLGAAMVLSAPYMPGRAGWPPGIIMP
jgi:hypothetical protein